jgi:hypothetical protein
MGRAMLFLVSGMVIVSGIIQMSNNNRAKLLPEETSEYFYEQQARNIATSLVDNAIQNLLRDMQWTDSIGADKYYPGRGMLKMYDMNSSELNTIDNSVQNWDDYKVLFISKGTYGGYTAETEVLMQRDSFSKFSYFTDAEQTPGGQQIWFWDDDELTGPVHTNGTYHMAGSPTFKGKITSPNDWVKYDNSTNPNFLGGYNFNLAKTRDLPSASQIQDLENSAAAGGITFNSDADLEFYVSGNEGYVKSTEEVTTQCCCNYWGNTYSCTKKQETSYKLSDYNGLISVDGKVNVKGTVKGAVTLHSTQRIQIMGDIYYDTDPTTDPNSTDLLGLVSEGDVDVDRDAHKDHGSKDLTIQASIMALGTSFGVESYNSGGARGKLNLLGGIIQKYRGAVGTFSGNNISTGYSKNYVYDTRLQSTIPPSFPRESIFTIVYWKNKTVKKTN